MTSSALPYGSGTSPKYDIDTWNNDSVSLGRIWGMLGGGAILKTNIPPVQLAG